MKYNKKMIYIIIFGITVIIVLVGIFVYKNGKVERECRKYAEDTRILTARPDGDNAAEESFYYCLIKKGVDPYKYKWQGKEVSEHARQYIYKMLK